MHPLSIQSKIFSIRGQQVMLDFDLAELYQTETKRLKEAVRRNISRFQEDFMFELNKKEFQSLRSQIASSNRGGTRYKPFAFTEQGIAMLSRELNSETAIQVNISIMRAFVVFRQLSLNHKQLTEKLKELDTKYNQQFRDVFEAINYLLKKEKQLADQTARRRIGYKKDDN
jgi:hypothetical protein